MNTMRPSPDKTRSGLTVIHDLHNKERKKRVTSLSKQFHVVEFLYGVVGVVAVFFLVWVVYIILWVYTPLGR